MKPMSITKPVLKSIVYAVLNKCYNKHVTKREINITGIIEQAGYIKSGLVQKEVIPWLVNQGYINQISTSIGIAYTTTNIKDVDKITDLFFEYLVNRWGNTAKTKAQNKVYNNAPIKLYDKVYIINRNQIVEYQVYGILEEIETDDVDIENPKHRIVKQYKLYNKALNNLLNTSESVFRTIQEALEYLKNNIISFE